MVKDQPPDKANDLPAKIGNPARRALNAVGITRLDQLPGKTERELAALHGMGLKALGVLRDALAANGQSFKDAKPDF
jgi:hypothetical protein